MKDIKYPAIIENFNKSTNALAQDILNEMKKDSKTYKEVKSKIKSLEKEIAWESGDQCQSLFNQVKSLLNEEMNDLPTTNRS